MLSNKYKFYLGTFVIYIILVAFFGYYTKQTALVHSENNIREYLISVKAHRLFVSQQQKAEIYKLKDKNILDKEFFSPILLSSTYCAREVNKYYNEIRSKLQLPEITIRFASNNPLNLSNKATTHEADLLKMFNEKKDVKYFKEVVKEKDGDSLYVAVPTRPNSSKCMRCHSDPKLAPKELVKMYGNTHGFHEQIGTIRGIITAHYPLQKEYERAYGVTYILGIALFVGLMIIWYIYYRFTSIIENKNEQLESTNLDLEEQIQKQLIEMVNLNDQLNYVIEGSQLGYWDWYPKIKKHYVNDIWLEMLGLDRSDVHDHEDDWRSRVHPDDLENTKETIDRAIQTGNSYTVEFRMKHKDGHWVWIQGAGAVVEYDKNKEPIRICGTHMDISQKKLSEFKINEMKEYLDTIFYQNPNIIIVRDEMGLIHANKLFFEFFDEYEESDTLHEGSQCICDFFEFVDDPDFIHVSKNSDWIEQILNNPNNKVLIKRGENSYYFTLNARKIHLNDQELQIVSFTDITQIQNLKEKLKTASIVDELTGLYNRRYFNEFFNREIQRAKRDKKTLTFMMIDVDHFKTYNDNYGHLEGDRVLYEVAQQMKSKMKRAEDFVFRLGGEEFGVIVTGFNKKDVLDYALEIKNGISSLQIEHKFTNNNYDHITVSIGLKHVDFNKEDLTTEDIYAMADKSLYQAKHKGRNTVISS